MKSSSQRLSHFRKTLRSRQIEAIQQKIRQEYLTSPPTSSYCSSNSHSQPPSPDLQLFRGQLLVQLEEKSQQKEMQREWIYEQNEVRKIIHEMQLQQAGNISLPQLKVVVMLICGQLHSSNKISLVSKALAVASSSFFKVIVGALDMLAVAQQGSQNDQLYRDLLELVYLGNILLEMLEGMEDSFFKRHFFKLLFQKIMIFDQTATLQQFPSLLEKAFELSVQTILRESVDQFLESILEIINFVMTQEDCLVRPLRIDKLCCLLRTSLGLISEGSFVSWKKMALLLFPIAQLFCQAHAQQMTEELLQILGEISLFGIALQYDPQQDFTSARESLLMLILNLTQFISQGSELKLQGNVFDKWLLFCQKVVVEQINMSNNDQSLPIACSLLKLFGQEGHQKMKNLIDELQPFQQHNPAFQKLLQISLEKQQQYQ